MLASLYRRNDYLSIESEYNVKSRNSFDKKRLNYILQADDSLSLWATFYKPIETLKS